MFMVNKDYHWTLTFSLHVVTDSEPAGRQISRCFNLYTHASV